MNRNRIVGVPGFASRLRQQAAAKRGGAIVPDFARVEKRICDWKKFADFNLVDLVGQKVNVDVQNVNGRGIITNAFQNLAPVKLKAQEIYDELKEVALPKVKPTLNDVGRAIVALKYNRTKENAEYYAKKARNTVWAANSDDKQRMDALWSLHYEEDNRCNQIIKDNSDFIRADIETLRLNNYLGAPWRPLISQSLADSYINGLQFWIDSYIDAAEELYAAACDADDTDVLAFAYRRRETFEEGSTHRGAAKCIDDFGTDGMFERIGNGHFSVAYAITGEDRFIIKYGKAGYEDNGYDWLQWCVKHQHLQGVPTVAALRMVERAGGSYYLAVIEAANSVQELRRDDYNAESIEQATRMIAEVGTYGFADEGCTVSRSLFEFFFSCGRFAWAEKFIEAAAALETACYYAITEKANLNDLHGGNVMISAYGKRPLITDPCCGTSKYDRITEYGTEGIINGTRS